jgi:2-hydroxy-6-oxonona-2,4-dienedioate hydrolase
MTMQILQYPAAVDGTTIRVLECGAGVNALLCLHGAGSRADRWRPALPLLAAAGFHVYAIDFPGHGLAAKPADYDYGSPAFARAAVDFLDTVEEPTVSILGTSIGGHVAALAACVRRERIRSTVLIGAVGLTHLKRSADTVRSPIVDTSLVGIRTKLEFLVENQQLVTEDWIYEESKINSSPGANDALAQLGEYSASRLDNDLVGEAYAALGIPTMLCWGAEDRWIPPSVGDDVARLLPDAALALVDGTGHAPYFERPSAFVDAVTPFLRDPDAYGSGTFTV